MLETKSKRTYTKRTKQERIERLQARIATLKSCHATRAQLIERLEAKVNGTTQ